jgi:hypothetical protein
MLMYPFLEPYTYSDGKTRSADVDRKEIPPGSSIFYIFPNKKMALSLFDGPARFTRQGVHCVVPEGSTIPPGLAVSKDKSNDRLGYTHYSVHATMVMHEMHYLFLLRRFAASAITLKAWKAMFPARATTLGI